MSPAEILKSLARDKASDLIEELPQILATAAGKHHATAGILAGAVMAEIVKVAKPLLYEGIDQIADQLVLWFEDVRKELSGDDYAAFINVGKLIIQ